MAPKLFSNMDNRQKTTAVAFVIIMLIIAYMLYSMFKGESTDIKPSVAQPSGPINATGPMQGGMAPPIIAPKQAQLPKQPPPLSPREAQLLQMQQETEMKYIDALNQLQMLKLERDIAETNKSIVAAKLDTITAEKNIINLLKPQMTTTPASYAQGLVTPVAGAPAGGPPANIPPPQMRQEETNYTVISVSFLRSVWSAVLGYQGNLYNVHVGDILPVDGSKVLSIDRTGLILEKDGIRRKISMVPII